MEYKDFNGLQAAQRLQQLAEQPYGLAGGRSGRRGRNVLVRADGEEQDLPGKASLDLGAGDTLSLRTPGGGGWGKD